MFEPFFSRRAPVVAVMAVTMAASTGCGDDASLQPVNYLGDLTPNAVDFGAVVIGDTTSAEVVLHNSGEGSLSVTGVENVDGSSDEIYLHQLSNLSIGAGELRALEVIFAPVTLGEKTATIRVKVKELEAPLELTVRASAVEPPRLEVEPNALDFGTIDLGEEIRASVLLENFGDVDAVLSSARLEADTFLLASSLPLAIAPGESKRVEVVFRPARIGEHRDALKLSGPTAAAPLIQLLGSAQESHGGLSCTPSQVSFGEVERGKVGRAMIECSATGTVQFSSLDLPDQPSYFVIPQAPSAGTLRPGQKLSWAVEFRAEGVEADYQSTLTIHYRGVLGAQLIPVDLTGHVALPRESETAVSILLRWDTAADLDLHFVRAGGIPFARDGSDCHYGFRTPDWGTGGDRNDDPFLDRDDVDGFGPELINLLRAAQGDYDIYVHAFSGTERAEVNAELELFLGGVSAGVFRRGLNCRELWHAGTVHWSGSAGTFAPSDEVELSSEGRCSP